MSWSNDPELQQMFIDEVTERSDRLVEGAQALRAGTITPPEAADLVREGHTIKGTGRVMGYDDVASAGLMLEMLWRWIQHEDISPAPIFGRVLEALSSTIPGALDDPAELSEAMSAIHEFFEGQSLPEELPPAPSVEIVTPVEESVPEALVETEETADVEEAAFASIADRFDAPEEVIDDGESAADLPVVNEEPEAPLSAQEAFAALRRSMHMEDDEPEVPEAEGRQDEDLSLADRIEIAAAQPVDDPSLADEETEVDPVSVEPELIDEHSDAAIDQPVAEIDVVELEVAEPSFDAEPVVETTVADEDPVTVAEIDVVELEVAEPSFDAEPVVETTIVDEDLITDAVIVDEEPTIDEAIGDVIEFPLNESIADEAPVETRTEITGGDGKTLEQDSRRPDVVVLPSNSKRPMAMSVEPGDLGGLVRAVQTWAVEEAISVNAGRLYGLVDHIVSLRMDIESVKEQLAELSQVAAADPFFAERISEISDGIGPIVQASDGIEERALGLAAAPLQDVTNTLPQLGRYLSRKTGNEIRIELVGDDILVDRQVLDQLGDAIRQLVVNAAVHGIEDVDVRLGADKPGTGVIRIEAHKTDVNLEVSIIDDGRGIDWRAVTDRGQSLGLLEPDAERSPDALRSLLYKSGFSTRETQDELAGDGEGLAIVQEAMVAMNGTLTVQSKPGEQTKVSMTVPVHQAMQKAMLVMAGGIMWGIPETGVQDVIGMSEATIAVTDHATVLERSDGDVPFSAFADLMGLAADGVPTAIVIAASAVGSIALGVDEVIGVRRVAAKELGAVLAEADAITGAALLGGDEVVLLVDTTRLAERQRVVASDAPTFPPARVLIVDDSRGVQQVVSSALATSGFNTAVAASVADALGALHSGSYDAIIVDFSMPRADGVALAHMVRQRHGDLPIVMLSGVAEGEDVDRAREAGVDAFFGKADFREGGLAEKLRELIAIRRAKEQTA